MSSAQRAVEEYVDERSADDTEFVMHLSRYRNALNSKGFDSGYISLFMHKFEKIHHKYDAYDAFCFSLFHNLVYAKKIALLRIPMNDEPLADAEVTEQNELLARLPMPFTAKFYGGKGDDDGWLRWHTNIKLALYANGFTQTVEIDPGQASLEIGYTEPSTTIYHLLRGRYLARWPYGDKCITLMFYSGPLMGDLVWARMKLTSVGTETLCPLELFDIKNNHFIVTKIFVPDGPEHWQSTWSDSQR